MKTLLYFYSKFVKKYIRGKCIIDSNIDSTAKINSGCSIVDSIVGAYSYCSYNCNIIRTVIGRFCSIANDVIIGGDEHPMDWLSTSPVFQNVKHSGPKIRFAHHTLPPIHKTFIGNDVWVANRVIIKQGVTIGDGAVIGAGAIVTKDVPPYAIVVGAPAKVIRYRFDANTISKLMIIQWWNFPLSKLKMYSDYIPYVDKFIYLIEHQGVR